MFKLIPLAIIASLCGDCGDDAACAAECSEEAAETPAAD